MRQGRIEVFQYLGYHGSFARERRLLWKCEAVGLDGERREADWHGNPKKKYANQEAKGWHEFTGWPIVELGRNTSKDDELK